MITQAQIEERKQGIGGSDMPIILGLSNYKTPYQLYLEKKGILSTGEEMSPLQYWGNRLEAIVREEFMLRNNVKVEIPDTLIHPIFDFIRANVDGYIPDWDNVLEIKCSSQFMAQEWGENGSDIVPLSYLVQVAHYCAVMNASGARIAVLIGGNDYREFIYKRDLELEETVIDAANSFWKAIQDDNAPLPVNQSDLKIMFPKNTPDKSIAVINEVSENLHELYAVRNTIKELQDIEEKAKFKIMCYMEDSECLLDEKGRPLATWKSNKKGSRVFLLKGDKS
jgi:putative phage-type endonuclease